MSQMLLEEAPPAPDEFAPAQPTLPTTDLGPRWLPALVLLAAAGLGAFIYSGFTQHSRDLWWWVGHDRHSHYMFGLNLAYDVKTADFSRLFHDLDRLRVWGPLHPLLVAIVELIGGPDHRLAVLPSLMGWILAIWCAFLIPRRLLSDGGNVAGLLAAFFVAISPAHRAFATDVMLESLGAGLSLAILYLYLCTLQEQSRRYAMLLGVALTALFLHKYNYWLLVTLGLIAGEFLRQPRAWLNYGLSLCQRDRLPSWLLGETKQPLNYLALGLAGAAAYVIVTGGGVIEIGKWHLSFTEPHNLIHAAYVAVFVRALWWWRKAGSAWSAELPMTLRTVLLIHGGAIAIWFLLPKRLSYFLWFLSPANNDQHRESVTFMHGLPHYLQGLQADYLTSSWAVYLMAAGLVLALLAWPKLKPGSAAVFCFFAIAAYLTCQHPMLKYRFMHSWIAAGSVLSATGLVFAVQQLTGVISQPARLWAAGLGCAIVIGLLSPAFLEPGHAQEGGLKAELPSPLRITEIYLPALADARQPTIVSNVSARFLWTWTFIEHHHHQNMAAEIKNFKAFDGHPEAAKAWLESTRSEALVLIDVAPGSPFDLRTDEYVDLAAFHQALAAQTAWQQTRRWELQDGVTITMWTKSANQQAKTQ